MAASSTPILGNLLTATVEICGTRPLLWHHFGIDAIPLQKQETEGVAGHNPNEWGYGNDSCKSEPFASEGYKSLSALRLPR